MNPFDTVIIVILGYCIIRGFFRGLIKEVASIIGVIGGFYAGYTYYSVVARYLSEWIPSQTYSNILGFMFLFCGVFVAVSLMGVILKYLMNIAFMGWIDRISGTIFGAAKGILITSIILVILTAFLPKGAPILANSHLAPHVSDVAEAMSKIVSKEIKQDFTNKFKDLKRFWNQQN